MEMSWLEAAPTVDDKNRRLVDLLTRKSVAHYKTFIDCLELCSQPHVARLLRNNAGPSTVHYIASLLYV